MEKYNLDLILSTALFIASVILVLITVSIDKSTKKVNKETKGLLKNVELEDCEIVQRKWLKSLLEHAEKFEEKAKDYEYSNLTNYENDKIHMEAVSLMGYAKSVKYIIKEATK